jgi:REP element-mobilizing transposase RayT
MSLAYFSTWTTYGTLLPGDDRGWFKRGKGEQCPNPLREFESMLHMKEDAVIFNLQQRAIVEKTIADHCQHRGWTLHAVSCRTNHVHAVVTAPGRDINVPREQFKAWCTRKLMEYERQLTACSDAKIRESWWTERGWDEYIDHEKSLIEVVGYVGEGQ